MKKILILAQTPPPYHGQSIMQQYLVDAKWAWCNKKHIRMNFSETIGEVTEFRFTKLFRLLKLVYLLIKELLSGRIDIIYYPPSGPHRVSLYRDFVLLPFVRLFSDKVVFHFHAGGFDQILTRFNRVEIALAKRIYRNPELAIVLLPSLEKEVQWINPQNVKSIPNGIEDRYVAGENPKGKREFKILFVGNLIEKKGVITLIEALKMLKSQEEIKVVFVGGWRDIELKKNVENFLTENNLSGSVEFAGIKNKEEKWKYFSEADVFCLPTFETEAMPITIIEAMMFGLPVISTEWRGIPDIIRDGVDGMLVPVKDPESLAGKIMELYKNKDLRTQLSRNARNKYEKLFRIEKHLSEMEKVFKQL